MLHNSYSFKSDHRKLLSIQAMHNYFRSGLMDNCSLLPTHSTNELLRNYEIRLKSIPSGIVLIGSNADRFKSSSFNGALSLDFYLYSNDPFFFNYTDIAYDTDKTLSFSNDFKNSYLHKNRFVDTDCQVDTNYSNGVNAIIKLVINRDNEYFGESLSKENNIYKEYFINFNSRKIATRFNISGAINSNNIDEFYVEDDQKNALNLSFEERKLNSGNTVFSAIMNEKYQLTQQLDQHFYLKKKDNTFNTFSKYFPHPKIQALSFNTELELYIMDTFIAVT